MPKAVKKSAKKKPSRQETVDTGDAGNEVLVTEREDGAETAVLTGGMSRQEGQGLKIPLLEMTP